MGPEGVGARLARRRPLRPLGEFKSCGLACYFCNSRSICASTDLTWGVWEDEGEWICCKCMKSTRTKVPQARPGLCADSAAIRLASDTMRWPFSDHAGSLRSHWASSEGLNFEAQLSPHPPGPRSITPLSSILVIQRRSNMQPRGFTTFALERAQDTRHPATRHAATYSTLRPWF